MDEEPSGGADAGLVWGLSLFLLALLGLLAVAAVLIARKRENSKQMGVELLGYTGKPQLKCLGSNNGPEAGEANDEPKRSLGWSAVVGVGGVPSAKSTAASSARHTSGSEVGATVGIMPAGDAHRASRMARARANSGTGNSFFARLFPQPRSAAILRDYTQDPTNVSSLPVLIEPSTRESRASRFSRRSMASESEANRRSQLTMDNL